MRTVLLCMFLSLPVLAAELDEQILDAARTGDLAAVKSALEKGAPIEAKTRHGVTPLFFAAGNGHLEVVKLLIEKGANVNAKDTFYGMTALARAVSKGHAEVVKLMIERGADTPDQALSSAVMSDKPDVVKVVLATGKTTEKGQKQAMQFAMQQKRTAVVDILKAAGIQPPDPVKYIDVDPAELSKYAGKYRDERQSEFALTVKDGGLMVSPPGGLPMQLKAVDATTFHIATAPGISVRVVIADGKVTGLVVDQMGNQMNLKKVE